MEEDRLAVFPTRLRCLRLARGMTQQMVAESLNIHRTTYTKYETGKASPDQESLLTLARLFRVSVGYLLGQEDSICHTESALENGAGITTLSPALFCGLSKYNNIARSASCSICPDSRKLSKVGGLSGSVWLPALESCARATTQIPDVCAKA